MCILENEKGIMFRVTLLKYIVRKRAIYDNVLLQNNLKFNYFYNCQCISSAKLAQTTKGALLTSKFKYNEEQPKSELNNSLSEQEFLVRLKDDPDTFGSPQEKEILDEGDIREEKYFTEQPSPSQKLRTKQYADIIKKLIRQHKIKEAIDLVEVRMIKEDRVKPENYIYNLLLGACGRVGYTKKAFMLYNQMKKRGLTVTGGTYTALFNACANSPWATTDGLTRATHLRNIMIEKGYEPNDTNYNAMIKAFGRCGDLPMAFTLADEMSSKRIKIRDDTINFLLQACITDKEAGFRHALLVWRKLVDKRIKPNIHTFNLMLRCIRDCGLGDVEVTQDVINRILSGKTNFKVKAKKDLLGDPNQKLLATNIETVNEEEINKNANNTLIKNSSDIAEDNNDSLREDALTSTSGGNDNMEEASKTIDNTLQLSKNSNDTVRNNISETNIAKVHLGENTSEKDSKITLNHSQLNDLRPNLMAKIPHLGSVISLSEVTKAEERLLLVGGSNGFLETMKQYECTPDIKTFTQMLDSIPSTLAAEKDLLLAMKKLNVKPDVDFYNMLIKRRNLRSDYDGAKEVLRLMSKQKYRPDVVTYGVLALGCQTKEECLELINEMKEASYSLNAEILGAMLYQACHKKDVDYVLELMEICLRENVVANKIFMESLEKFKKSCNHLLKNKQFTKRQEKSVIAFRARYRDWVQEVQVDDAEDAHPWQQYRQGTEGGGNCYKWKDTARFKARHTSLFKVKTSAKHAK